MTKKRNIHAETFVKLFSGTMVSTEVDGRFEIGYIGGYNRLADMTRDHYFFPNGGTKESDVKHLSTLFIDLDAGRDTNGKYLPLSKVRTKKNAMMKRIADFSSSFMSPTYIIETRNGYQVYWRFSSCIPKTAMNLRKWKDSEKRLWTFFKGCGADSKVLKPNQLMRVPYTTWNKKKEGMQPFKCTKSGSGGTYNFDFCYNNLSTIKMDTPNRSSGWSNNKPKYGVKVNFQPHNELVGKVTQQVSKVVDKVNESLILEVVDFLREIAPQFKYQNKLYTERTALRLADELMKG